jgi:hypothetical protein
MEYPERCSFFAHKFVRLLTKSCAAQDIGRDAFALLCVIVHQEDAARYSGPVRFWNEQLMNVLGFKSPKQLNDCRKRAIDFAWLNYERAGNREVGRYAVAIPENFEGLSDDIIEDIHSTGGMNSGMNSGMNKGRIPERISDELRNEKVTESGKPSIPVPVPIYSPGSEIQIPKSMNTPEVIAMVGKWFSHLESKDKPEKVPMPNSPQEESFWLQIAKMGPERFIAAATKSMAEGWVGLREERTSQSNGGTNGQYPDDLLKICTVCKQHPQEPAKRREILGPKLHEISRRLDVQTILSSIGDDWKMKSLNQFYGQHLKDLECKTT